MLVNTSTRYVASRANAFARIRGRVRARSRRGDGRWWCDGGVGILVAFDVDPPDDRFQFRLLDRNVADAVAFGDAADQLVRADRLAIEAQAYDVARSRFDFGPATVEVGIAFAELTTSVRCVPYCSLMRSICPS